MKNIQRSLRVLALLTLLLLTFTLQAQEATDEPATPVEATAEVTEPVEMTEEADAPDEATEEADAPDEATEEANASDEATEEADTSDEVTPEATPAPEMTAEPVASIEETAGTPVTVVGSGIVNPALASLVDTSGSTLDYSFNTTGTNAGFEAFCADEADITTSIRPISVEEDTACRNNGVEFLELLIGYDVLAVVSNPEDEFLTCLTADNLNVLLSPSATVSNWDALGFGETAPTSEADAESTEEPTMMPDVTVILPEDTTPAFENLDSLVTGFGFRADVDSADTATTLETVATTNGAIGFVPLADALNAGERVAIVDLNLVGAGCITPSVQTVENEVYPAGTAFYLYVASDMLETLAFLLDYLTQADSAVALADAGYTPISEEARLLNAAIVSGDVAARAATAEEITYPIPQGLTGNVSVAGALAGFSIGDSVANRLTSTQQSLVIDTNFAGTVAGTEAFCNEELDILFVDGASDSLCDGAVEFVEFDFGAQAVVLIGNATDSFATCLTPDQVNTIWSTSSEAVTNWSSVGDGFPDQEMILVGLDAGSQLTGILMSSISEGAPSPMRVDVAETNSDTNYRATAVGNISGSMSYMSWVDYQELPEAMASNIQLVAINTGDGCVVPSEETIIDGTYPIARDLRMVVNQASLARVEVQSYVWSVFADESASIIGASDFVGGYQEQQTISFRSDLLATFETAEQMVADATMTEAEVTPEATEEATDE